MSDDTKTIERRAHVGVDERAAGDASTVYGYAAVFGQWADIGGSFSEMIAPGAFADTLKTSDVRAYFGHDSGRVLGRTSAGTLRLSEDETGLAVEIDLPDTTDGRDAKTSIARRDITGMSFGFRVTREEWDFKVEPPKRTIKAVDLREVSIVSDPAYDGTSIALRSLDDARKERRQNNFAAAARRIGMKMTLDLKVKSRSKA